MISERCKKLKPYVPGEQPKDKVYIKLNANENPYPPSPVLLNSVKNIDFSKISRYPDPDSTLLRQAISKIIDVRPDMILCGNGSDEVLSFVFYAFFESAKPVLSPELSYSFYPVYAGYYDIQLKKIPFATNYSVDLNDYLNKDCSGVIFANPNAPTGIGLSCETIEDFLQKFSSDTVVVVDEAYVDFGGETVIPLLKKYKNLVVIRTFSKCGSFAGSRLGYAVANPDLIKVLTTVKNSFNHFPIDYVTQQLGIKICENWDYYKNNCKKIIKTRENFVDYLKKNNWTVLPSMTNFLLVKHPSLSGEVVYKHVRDQGILIRYFDQDGMRDFVRISIGTDEEMESLKKILDTIR